MTAVVLSEIYPPAIGGSGEFLHNVYARLQGIDVVVSTEPAEEEPADVPPHLRIVRENIHADAWGLASPSALIHHVRRAAQIRRTSRGPSTVVHCARALPEGVDAWMARMSGGAPYVCWAHGEDIASARTSREFDWLNRRVLQGASAVVANSRNTAAMARACGVRASKVVVVYPGVDVERFRPGVPGADHVRARLAGADVPLLLTVGRLQRRKGHDLTLEAVAVLRDLGYRLRYVIVGDGADRDRLVQMVKTLELDETVVFTGAVPAEDLPRYYAAADVFCHPNRVDGADIEGFGIVFLEAAASGLPVIGGNSGGVPEAIAAGETGVLVDGASVEELAAAIRRLVSDGRGMGLAGRARVVRDFSWERAAATVADVHRRIVRDHGVE